VSSAAATVDAIIEMDAAATIDTPSVILLCQFAGNTASLL
jgi:hypothetical protein